MLNEELDDLKDASWVCSMSEFWGCEVGVIVLVYSCLGNPTGNGNVERFCLMPCVDFQVLRKMQRRHSSNTDNGPPER